MESTTPTVPETPAHPTAPITPRTTSTRRGGGVLVALLAVAALGASGYAIWRVDSALRSAAASRSDQLGRLEERVDQASHDDGQLRKDLDTLRARLRDADTVNKGLREEMLGLAERSRHLDDAIANLADQRLSGRDALALNEAEFLLLMGQERYALFGEAGAALAAYQLADHALAASEDPVFASVRLTIGAETRALQAAQAADVSAPLPALGALRDGAAQWPTRSQQVADDPAASRFARVFARFIRIRHDDDALATRDPSLARSLLTIDLQAAAAAWLARDPAAWRAALTRARGGIAGSYDDAAEPVRQALAEIDRLAALPVAPPVPVLGTALKELRDMRANRALSRQPAVAPVEPPAPEATAPAPESAATSGGTP